MPRDPAARWSFPPDERLEVITLASERTAEHDCPATRWTLDDLARELVNRHADEALRRSTIQRILHTADLQPHRSVYWLNSHDPDFGAKATAICQLYVRSPVLAQQGELVICTDEKTGMQILQRKYPTQPARPGYPEKGEHEYIRHGTRALIASFVVSTGEVVWNLGPTRTSIDFANHLRRVANRFRDWNRITWVVDNLNTHWSLEACQVLAALNSLLFEPRRLQTGAQRRAFLADPEHGHRFVFTPTHGSWLNQVELWFSVLARRFLKRGDFSSPVEFERRLAKYLDTYNARHAHPYRWTYTGQPLVRATPFSQTRRQQRQGRAWFGTRRQRFDRFLYSPRPYKRRTARDCTETSETVI
jgi:DDE superfamily endonuclease